MNCKTILIGGGFAGRQAARALRRSKAEILLFDPDEETVMIPALPDLAGGWLKESLLTCPLADILPQNVRHIPHAVTAIDLDAKTVTADGELFAFDQLLIAAGSVTDFHGFDRHLEKIHRLDSLESALRIRHDFHSYLQSTEKPHVVVSGGGYTGLELAMSLFFLAKANGRLCRVTVVDPAPDILTFLPQDKQQRLKRFLESNGVTVLNGQKVTDYDGQTVTAGEHRFDNAFFCWAGGSCFAVPEMKGSVDRLRDGRLKVNPDLSLPGYPDVFAAGDAAAFEQNGTVLRKAVNFAWYEGLRAGRNLCRRQKNKPTRPFKPFDAGWVIPLHGDSVGKILSLFWMTGKTGLRMHYFMCGFRNCGFANFAGFARIALHLFNNRRKESIP
jgi:NADH:ubiquinone reductase (H+-translocating)